MAKATICTTVDWELAELIEYDAISKNTTVSHIIRNILTEQYKKSMKKTTEN